MLLSLFQFFSGAAHETGNQSKQVPGLYSERFTLKNLRSLALPWDKSINPIEYYLILEDYFNDRAKNGKVRGLSQSVFCANFVDFCLRKNAEYFTKHVKFMNASDIQVAFMDFTCDLSVYKVDLDKPSLGPQTK